MSLKLRKQDDRLEVLEGELPEGEEIRLYTEDEVLQFEGWRQWVSLTQEQREDMMFQSTSAGYQEWMEEDDWDECKLGEDPASYNQKEFEA